MNAGRTISITVIALCEVLALALWFSASAVVPALKAEGAVGPVTAALFTSAVQVGFVAGTLASAFFALPDRYDPRLLFSISGVIAALANALILTLEPGSPWVVVLRFVTGACMAGIYPVGMKLVITWSRADMGLLVGLLVGALTLGSASPYLFNALGGIDWRFTLAATSVSALVAAALIWCAGIGPRIGPAPPFRPSLALAAWTSPALRLANLGYLGHMWELYAMWAWIGLFLNASYRVSLADPSMAGVYAALATFATIGAGAAGSIVAGVFADRVGRTFVTIVAMAISGACALTIGFLFGASAWLVLLVSLVWGASVVADSAQFSASIAELAERSLVGTMLTVQTSMGFLLTLLTIHLLPGLVESFGWRYAFAVLALGPAVGIVAMARLRAMPEATRIAGGRR